MPYWPGDCDTIMILVYGTLSMACCVMTVFCISLLVTSVAEDSIRNDVVFSNDAVC